MTFRQALSGISAIIYSLTSFNFVFGIIIQNMNINIFVLIYSVIKIIFVLFLELMINGKYFSSEEN
jgi:hypothetical protein